MSGLVIPRTTVGKTAAALAYAVRHPGTSLRFLSKALAGVYGEGLAAKRALPTVRLSELIGPETQVTLSNFTLRNGNVSLFELTAIAGLVRAHQPRTLLEIGTFDGNTTLQMAHNSPADARVITLDLPADHDAAGELEVDDHKYVQDEKKLARKYQNTPVASKVTQCLGDSATFDFGSVIEPGTLDFAFIDGSHSYDYVRNDTEKVLELLAPKGIVLWHDFAPAWPGVMSYLLERESELGLRNIRGTTLVLMTR